MLLVHTERMGKQEFHLTLNLSVNDAGEGVEEMARMTFEQIMARSSTIDWDKVNATTETDIAHHATQDGTEMPEGKQSSPPAIGHSLPVESARMFPATT
ncbi:MAG: hypothetical protein ABF785_08995 [Acetobacter papayae]|uniref:hypothetical protein n=1 Tax=Acetobacter papayae TaxID=1076592 RepID=UPI0039ECCF6E